MFSFLRSRHVAYGVVFVKQFMSHGKIAQAIVSETSNGKAFPIPQVICSIILSDMIVRLM